MQIIKINPRHPSKSVLQKAVEVLKQGGVIVYPTETAYALGCGIGNKQVLSRVFKIKERPLRKALPLIAGTVAMVQKFCRINSTEAHLIKKYWPGPLTLVLNAKQPVSEYLISKRKDGVAMRVSGSKIARLISQKLGRPIISTSANISIKPACYSVDCFLKQFKNKKNLPDLILDAGRLPKRKPSTIVKVVDGKIEILRQGPIKL